MPLKADHAAPLSSSAITQDTMQDDQDHNQDTRTTRSSLPGATPTAPSRILFGSCNNQNLTQPLWPVIESRNAAAFVWGGDAIYADVYSGVNITRFPPRPTFSHATPQRLHTFYQTQRQSSNYATFLLNSPNISIFGTIDDHDMGANNGDKTFRNGRESGMAFLKFTGEPKESPMVKRAKRGLGVYGVKVFDFSRPEGRRLLDESEAGIDPDVVGYGSQDHGRKSTAVNWNHTVAVFVLDCRTNKDPWPSKDDTGPVPLSSDFLGERQWQWFETAVQNSPAAANVIVNGLQVNPEPRTGDANVAEGWGQFPQARDRLYRAILNSGMQAPILVSGDVHMAQLMRKDCIPSRNTDVEREKSLLPSRFPRPLVEMTTSGMTHSWGTCASPQVRHHTRWYRHYSRFSSWAVMSINHILSPWLDLLQSKGNTPTSSEHDGSKRLYENGGAEGAKQGKQFSLDLNFGELEFDWVERTVTMRVLGVQPPQSRSTGNDGEVPPLLSAKWNLQQLSGSMYMPGGEAATKELLSQGYSGNSTALHHHQDDSPSAPSMKLLEQEWTCMDHRGTPHPFHATAAYALGWVVLTSFIMVPFVVPALLCLVICLRLVRLLRGVKRKASMRNKKLV